MASDETATEAVLLPALGESVTQGTVLRWLREVGDRVEVGEPLLEVSTDKVDTEIPSPATGTLLEVLVGADQEVEVGTRLATIGPGAVGGAIPDRASRPAAAARRPRPASAHLTHVVRRLATEHGVDLEGLTGTGLEGRIRKQDVLSVVSASPVATPTLAAVPASSPPSALPGQADGPSPLGRTTIGPMIAWPVVESLQTSAQLTSVVEVDVTDLLKVRDLTRVGFAAAEGVDLTVSALFAKACVDALRAYPMLNVSIDADAQRVVQHDQVNLAIAIDTPRGLQTPVISAAGDLSLAGLARRIEDITERTRAGSLRAEELAGGTFTLIDGENRGTLMETPTLNQSQAGSLGAGAVVRRAVVLHSEHLGETIAIRSMSYFALTYDHRLIGGVNAARFLNDVRRRLEEAQFGL